MSYITPKRYVRLENLTEDPSEETIRSKYAKYGNIKCVELVADCNCAVLEFAVGLFYDRQIIVVVISYKA